MTAVHNVAGLRQHVDHVVAALPLLALPRIEAVLHAFRVAQSGHAMHAASSNAAGSYENIRSVQDLLRWLTFKIATTCPTSGRIQNTTEIHRTLAREAIELFDKIAKLNEFMLIAQAGRCRVDFESDGGLIVFRYDDDLPSRRLGRRLARQRDERSASLASQVSNNFRETQELVDQAVPHVRPQWGDRQFVSRPGSAIERKIREHMDATSEPPLLPVDWSVGAYTFGEFRSFWMHLKALAWLRDLGFAACVKRRPDRIPWNGAVLSLSPRELLDRLESQEIVPRTAAIEILRDLTYDPAAFSWTDIMYQPLVPLDRHSLATIPLLISASHFERNLLAIIDRLPWRREAVQQLKEGREDLMIGAIVPAAEEVGVMTQPRVRLEERGADLTDIDLLLWQPDAEVALVVSLKWFYGPDSIREVLTHDDWYASGIEVAKRAVAHLSSNAEEVSRRYRLRPPLTPATLIVACIVGHHDVPSEWVRDDLVPIVKLDAFLAALRERAPDLRSVHARLREIAGIDEPGDEEVSSFHDDVRLGDLTVRFPSAD
jgi:hypothetical protein